MSRKDDKNFRLILSSVVKKYFQGKYTEEVSVFDVISTKLDGVDMSKADKDNLSRILQLFFLGQLTGLQSLNAILTHFGIHSSKEQVRYKDLCNRLSNKAFHQIFEELFKTEVERVLTEKMEKHGSSWSRELVTAVIDDSIFKQWLVLSVRIY